MLANVVSVLDAVPKTVVTTVTHLASGVMNLVQNKPLLAKKVDVMSLYWIVNGVIILFSMVLAFSVINLFKLYGQLNNNINNLSYTSQYIWWKYIKIILLHFIWTITVLIASMQLPIMKVLGQFQPDIVYWLMVTAGLVLVKGVVEIVLFSKIHKRNQT